VTSFVGEGASVLLRRAFAATGDPLDDAELARVASRYAAIYAAEPVIDTVPMPHAAEVLRALPLPLAICTNKPEGVARAVLGALGLADRFPVVVGGDTLPVRKPDPAPLRAAAAGLGVPLDRVVLVGDSEIDAATAEAAGVPFWWYTRGYHRAVPARVAATFGDWRALPGLAGG
jgi:phosphoglycolate phosphatase